MSGERWASGEFQVGVEMNRPRAAFCFGMQGANNINTDLAFRLAGRVDVQLTSQGYVFNRPGRIIAVGACINVGAFTAANTPRVDVNKIHSGATTTFTAAGSSVTGTGLWAWEGIASSPVTFVAGDILRVVVG